MKRLYLLRHAKAEAPESEQGDHARALTVRGLHDAGAMGRYLRKNGFVPALLLASSSARTLQTAELVMRETGDITLEPRDELYLAEAGKILAAVQAAPRATPSVMVVAHNPGLEELASLMAREPVARKDRARLDVLEEKFPTAALAVLDFAVDDWRDLRPGEGVLVEFVRPKDI